MAEAKREGGLYYLPDTKDADGKTIHGKAIDSEGVEVKDAPKRPENTSAEEMARVAQSSDPVQRLAETLDRTFGGGAHAAAMAAMGGTPKAPAAKKSGE
jgi:hypothetical protein